MPLRFEGCEFIDNTKIHVQHGGKPHAIDDSAQDTPPKVLPDGCRVDRDNGSARFLPEDIMTTRSPNHGEGRRHASVFDEEQGGQKSVVSMGLDGNGIVDGGDLGVLFTIWGTTGQIPRSGRTAGSASR